MEYKTTIENWLSEHKSSTVPGWLKRNPEIQQWVIQQTAEYQTKNIMQNLYILLNGAPEKCEYGNYRKFNTFDLGYRAGCVLGNRCQCVNKKRKSKQTATIVKKYGVSSVSAIPGVVEKRKQTTLKNWGVEFPAQSKTIRQQQLKSFMNRTEEEKIAGIEKAKSTNLQKYGVDHHMKTEQQKQKVITTNLSRYGVARPLQNFDIADKVRETWKNKSQGEIKNHRIKIKESKSSDELNKITNSFNTLFDREEFKNLINSSSTRKKVANELGIAVSTLYLYINHHTLKEELNKNSNSSAFEIEVGEFIESLGFEIKRNDRNIISPKELDIVVPEKNIAVECCGLYWHSESKNKHKNYHYDKYKACQQQGVFLITIFEDEWNYKKEIVKQRLQHKFNKTENSIPARKCQVKEITSEAANNFVEQYHIQGSIKSKINLAIIHEDTIVAVMTLGKARYSKQYEYELLRFCSSKHVVGAAGKLFSYFKKKYNPSSVISYSDNRWSNGLVYSHLGFVKQKETVGYYYTDYFVKYNRNHFQKHKLVAEGHDLSLSEWEIAQSLGYDRIWDCGQSLWLYTKT